MKNILLACGSGIATSTAAAAKLSKVLDENGFKGQYKIVQCKAAEVVSKSSSFDLCVATTVVSGDIKCPFVLGICFLTGVGMQAAVDKILEILRK